MIMKYGECAPADRLDLAGDAVNEFMHDMHEKRAQKGLWTMRDGTEIKVRDMSERHILNTIKMLERNNNPFAEIWIPAFKEELECRKCSRRIISGEL